MSGIHRRARLPVARSQSKSAAKHGPAINSWREKLNPNLLKFFAKVVGPALKRGFESDYQKYLDEFVKLFKSELGMPSEVQKEHICGPTALPELQLCLYYMTAFLYLQERPKTLEARNVAGDRKASHNLLRLNEVFTRLRYSEQVKPPKVDAFHWYVFMIGWKAGLQTLTQDELASCFDEVCPLHETHDAEALRKQRSRVASALTKFSDVFYSVA